MAIKVNQLLTVKDTVTNAIEQWINMKFYYKLGRKESHDMLVQMYVMEAVSKNLVYELLKLFYNGK